MLVERVSIQASPAKRVLPRGQELFQLVGLQGQELFLSVVPLEQELPQLVALPEQEAYPRPVFMKWQAAQAHLSTICQMGMASLS